MRKILISLGLLFLGLFLFLAALELPEMGNPKNPSQIYTASHYLEKGLKETGVENIVTAISLNYRGYDTFGEVILIFTALCSVLVVLKREKRKISYSGIDVLKSSIILQTVMTAFLPFSVLFAFYLILYGTISPGGGFQGGMLLGGFAIIFVVIFGLTGAMKRLPSQLRELFEGAAILFFTLVGLVGIISGTNFLALIIPTIPASYRLLMAKSILILLEMGFAMSIAAIFISIFFSMYREERQNV